MERNIDLEKCEWYNGGCIIKPGTENHRIFLENALLNNCYGVLSAFQKCREAEIHIIMSPNQFNRYCKEHCDTGILAVPMNQKVSDNIMDLPPNVRMVK